MNVWKTAAERRRQPDLRNETLFVELAVQSPEREANAVEKAQHSETVLVDLSPRKEMRLHAQSYPESRP